MKSLVQMVKTFRPDFPKLWFFGKWLCRYFRLVHNYHCSAITVPCAYIGHELSPLLKWNRCSPPIKLPEFCFSGVFFWWHYLLEWYFCSFMFWGLPCWGLFWQWGVLRNSTVLLLVWLPTEKHHSHHLVKPSWLADHWSASQSFLINCVQHRSVHGLLLISACSCCAGTVGESAAVGATYFILLPISYRAPFWRGVLGKGCQESSFFTVVRGGT